MHFFTVTEPLYVHFTQVKHKTAHEDLMRLLEDEDGVRAFMNHLVNEFAVESIKFYMEVILWKRSNAAKKKTMQNKLKWARLIYDSFLTSSSILQLNISSAQQNKIDAFFAQTLPEESEEYAQKLDLVFEEALKESIYLMSGSWQRFITSKLYHDYMSGGGGGGWNRNANNQAQAFVGIELEAGLGS